MITIEVPTDWINNPEDGHRHRQYFENVQNAARKLTKNIWLEPIRFGADFEPRRSEPNKLLLSFHSVGATGNILRIKEAAVFPYYCFEENGHSGWSTIANDTTLQERAIAHDDVDALAYLEHFTAEYRRSRVSKYSQKPNQAVNSRDYVLYLMQIAIDPVAHFARMTQYEIIDHLAAFAERHKVEVIVKRHPFCQDPHIKRYLDLACKASIYLRVSEANVLDLIENARSVITVNSGAGFETLLLGKAHYSVGSSEWDAISHQVHTPHDLEKAFNTEQSQNPRTKNYLAYLLNEYWVDITNIDNIAERINQKLEHVSQSKCDQNEVLPIEMTREEFCRYLAMKNRVQRVQQIVDENKLLRQKLRRSTTARIRRFFGLTRWYEE